nr:MAG TPA: BppU domain protein [Caudoviricetes sp.]
MVQGDANSRTIVATLWDGAQLYSVPAGAAAMVRFRKPDGTGGLYDTSESGQKVSYTGSIVTAPVATQMLAVAGDVFAEIDIFGGGAGAAAERLATFRFVVEVAPCVLPDAEIISSDYYNILASKVAEAVAAADRAGQAQSAAAASAEAAATSAANAATSVEGAVKYNTAQTLTDEQKKQARDNINAPAPYTAGENISISGSVIATKAFPCNPNLLDNWYFGNPVNQRNGKLVPAGITLYADSALTQVRGPNGDTEAVDLTYTSPTSVGWVSKIDGLTYYAAASDVVPGYKGPGYGIDRWRIEAGAAISLSDGALVLTGAPGAGIVQNSEALAELLDKRCTFSALTPSGDLYSAGLVIGSAAGGIEAGDFIVYSTSDTLLYVRPKDSSPKSILAVGLELGTQQTIAHRENGVWVLNEIPKFGNQLAECQRYAQNGYCYTVVGQLTYAGTNYIIPLRFPQDMRATPAITLKEISVFGWGNVPITGATVEWNSKYGAFVNITDLSNKDNFIGKACYVYYFASADL